MRSNCILISLDDINLQGDKSSFLTRLTRSFAMWLISVMRGGIHHTTHARSKGCKPKQGLKVLCIPLSRVATCSADLAMSILRSIHGTKVLYMFYLAMVLAWFLCVVGSLLLSCNPTKWVFESYTSNQSSTHHIANKLPWLTRYHWYLSAKPT